MTKLHLTLLLASTLTLGCGSEDTAPLSCVEAGLLQSTELGVAASSRQSCTDDADCVLVLPTNECSDGSRFSNCAVAIAVTEREAFETDLAARTEDVCAQLDAPCIASALCVMTEAACDEGTCVARAG